MKFFVLFFLFILILSGCATVPTGTDKTTPSDLISREGLYHRVEKGQTLWRISKLYNVDLESIIKSNRIGDATKISQGQMIFIPGARNTETISETERMYDSGSFIWPLKGRVISYFGLKKRDGTINKGIDILAKEGSDVMAAREGRVVFCSDKIRGFGKTVIIQHDESFTSVYANNDTILVKENQVVNKGYLIAKAGRTERSGDYLLHFEIRKGHVPQNPFYFLP